MNLMDSKGMIEEIRELSKEEQIGKRMLQLHGRSIDYAEYIYLLRHPEIQEPIQLMNPLAVQEQGRARMDYRKYRESGLSEEDFFPEGEDIVTQKLLCYVDIPEHRHAFYECSYVVSGSCRHVVNGAEFVQERGSFTFIPPQIPHALYPIEECLCLTVKIRASSFQTLSLPSISSFNYAMSFSCGDDPAVRQMILLMYLQQKDRKPYYEQLNTLLFHSILLYVLQNFMDESAAISPRSGKLKELMRILSYMAENYQTVTLQSVAEHFHYNEAYLSRMFHEQTSVTFSWIVRDYKLRKAAVFLQETNMTLDEICDAIGYKDVPRFIKNFKEKYEMTPGKFRKQGVAANHQP